MYLKKLINNFGVVGLGYCGNLFIKERLYRMVSYKPFWPMHRSIFNALRKSFCGCK